MEFSRVLFRSLPRLLRRLKPVVVDRPLHPLRGLPDFPGGGMAHARGGRTLPRQSMGRRRHDAGMVAVLATPVPQLRDAAAHLEPKRRGSPMNQEFSSYELALPILIAIIYWRLWASLRSEDARVGQEWGRAV